MIATIWDTLTSRLLDAFVLTLGAVFLFLCQRVQLWFKSKHTTISEIKKANELDSRIYHVLSQLRIRANALRVYVSKFHNGDAENKLSKKTRTHEVVREGIAYQSEIFRGMLLSSVPDEIKLVMSDGPAFTLVRDLPPGKFKWQMEDGGVKSIIRCAIKKGKDVIGFVGVDFDSEIPPPKDILQQSCDLAGHLAEYIK